MPPDTIRAMPANCPVPVKQVMEIRTATQGGKPPSTTTIPKVKATDKYPKQMGSPSLNPRRKVRWERSSTEAFAVVFSSAEFNSAELDSSVRVFSL